MDIDNAQGIGTDPQTERTYQKIARDLKQRIQAEGWSAGDRLPSERVLATDLVSVEHPSEKLCLL